MRKEIRLARPRELEIGGEYLAVMQGMLFVVMVEKLISPTFATCIVLKSDRSPHSVTRLYAHALHCIEQTNKPPED